MDTNRYDYAQTEKGKKGNKRKSTSVLRIIIVSDHFSFLITLRVKISLF